MAEAACTPACTPDPGAAADPLNHAPGAVGLAGLDEARQALGPAPFAASFL